MLFMVSVSSVCAAQSSEQRAAEGLQLVTAIREGDSSFILSAGITAIESDVDARGELNAKGSSSFTRPFRLSAKDLSDLLGECELRSFQASRFGSDTLWLCNEQSNWPIPGQRGSKTDHCYYKAYKLMLSYGFVDSEGNVEPKMLLDHRNFWNSEKCPDKIEPVVFVAPPAPEED